MQIVQVLDLVRAYHDEGIAAPRPLIGAILQTLTPDDLITLYAAILANDEYRPLIRYFMDYPSAGAPPEPGEDAEVGPCSIDTSGDSTVPSVTPPGVTPSADGFRMYG